MGAAVLPLVAFLHAVLVHERHDEKLDVFAEPTAVVVLGQGSAYDSFEHVGRHRFAAMVAAGEQYAAQLTRREPQHAVNSILRDELHRRAGGARHAATLTWLELDRMDEGAGRNVGQRQSVPGLDVGLRARLDDRADANSRGSENVGLGAVCVVEERDPGRPVGVVLDRGHLRGNPILRALEVDRPKAPLVAAALVARRDAAVVVAAALLRQRLEERLLRHGLRDVVESRDRHEAAPRARRLVLLQSHQTLAPSKISISCPSRN